MRWAIFVWMLLALLQSELAIAQSRVELDANGGLRVDGKPFLPIMAWAQPSENLGKLAGLGVNAVHVGDQEAKLPLRQYLARAHEAGILAIIDHHRFQAEVKDHPAVLAWLVEHEPETIRDGNTTADRPPAVQKANYERIRKEAPGALTWAIYSAGFYDHYRKIPAEQFEEYFKYCDVLAFDHYPVTGWNRPDRLPEMGLATREMVRMARPGQPVWTFLEACDQELSWTAPETRGPTPEEMRAEVWSSIANGAKGIGYFTIAFGRGSRYETMNLTPEMEQALRRVNADLQALAGPIVEGVAGKLQVSGDETKDKETKGRAIHAMRRDHGGGTCIVAVNVTRERVRPTVMAEGIRVKELAVWKEGRKVRPEAGSFTDVFEPLAVHIYTDEN